MGPGRDRRRRRPRRLAGAARAGHARGGRGAGRRRGRGAAHPRGAGAARRAAVARRPLRPRRDRPARPGSRGRALARPRAARARRDRGGGGARPGKRPRRRGAGSPCSRDPWRSSSSTDGGRVSGVLARHEAGALVLHRARAVVLATGGIGHLYARTTNPPEAQGDGIALAWRAGARLADMEFVQFHPTALDVGADPMPLLTEALRGAGAILVDERGRRVLAAPARRRAAPARRRRAGPLVGSRIGSSDVPGRSRLRWGSPSPSASRRCSRPAAVHGLDPRREPIPVAPAAHYHMGGVDVDLDGCTSVAGLWAAGEVACTGVHGANRLASNSLLEGLVFGARVARSVGEALAQLRPARTALPLAVGPARRGRRRERGGGRGRDPGTDVGRGRSRADRTRACVRRSPGWRRSRPARRPRRGRPATRSPSRASSRRRRSRGPRAAGLTSAPTTRSPIPPGAAVSC